MPTDDSQNDPILNDSIEPQVVNELAEKLGEDEAIEIGEIATNNNLDLDKAEEVKDLMDELGVDEDDAIEIADAL